MNNKPITILINEFKEKLIQTCNTSGLPACVLELALQNVYNDVSLLAKRQLQEDELYYANSLIANEKNKEVVSNEKESVSEEIQTN